MPNIGLSKKYRVSFVVALILTALTLVMAGDAIGRPNYQFLRFEEDWSVLKNAPESQRTDFVDRIKYIPLSDDGDIWLSLGGVRALGSRLGLILHLIRQTMTPSF